MRWLWLQKPHLDRPWANLGLSVHANVRALFAISVVTMVGDGRSTLFWSDRWLHGRLLVELALALMPFMAKRVIAK